VKTILKPIYRSIITLLCATAAVNAQATTTSAAANTNGIGGKMVKVNLIVFTHVNDQTLMTQAWRRQLIVPYVKDAIQLMPANYDPSQALSPSEKKPNFVSYYQLLPKNKIGMKSVVSKLNANQDKVVLNIAWKQPANESDQWVHFYGGQAYDQTGQPISQQDSSSNNVAPVYNAVFWQLNGLIKISYSRYFNVTSQMFLTLPKALGGDIKAQQYGLIPLMTYQSTTYRRVKLGQTAYFDHPLFGALIKISAIKPKSNTNQSN
jgi:hypothetical protein